MKAIVLAAGRGSRMQELTDDRPKCLVELDGVSLLDRQLLSLRTAGAAEIAIVTGYRAELLAHRADRTFHNPRWETTNMVASLATAREWLVHEPCIVSYSDIFYEPRAVRLLADDPAPISMTFDPNWAELWTRRFGDPLIDAETFRLDADGYIAEIGQKPGSLDEIEGQYMGLLRFTPSGWHEVEDLLTELEPSTADRIDMTSLLQRIVERARVRISAVAFDGEWGEVDSSDDLDAYG